MRRTLLGALAMLLLSAAGLAAAAPPTSSDLADSCGSLCLQPFLDVSGPRVSGPTWTALEAAGDLEFDPETGNYRVYWVSVDGTRKFWTFEPAGKVKVRVEAEVTQDASGAYRYLYTVHNLDASPQNLDRFMVRYDGAEIYDIAQPGELWRFVPRVYMVEPSAPVASWSSRFWPDATEEDVPGIPPGESASGFGFTSRQPPGVVTCYARGYVRGVSIMDPNPEAAPDPRPLPPLIGDCAVGTTIGPVSAAPGKLSEGYVVLGPLALGPSVPVASPETRQLLARSGEKSLRLVTGSQEVLVDGRATALSRPTLVEKEGHLAVSVDLLDLLAAPSEPIP